MSEPELIGGQGIPYAWSMSFCMNGALVVALPLCGWLGDVVGRFLNDEERGFRVVMRAGISITILIAIPAFAMICTRNVFLALLGQFCFVCSLSLYGANLPAFMISQFPPHRRYSGLGIGKFCTFIFYLPLVLPAIPVIVLIWILIISVQFCQRFIRGLCSTNSVSLGILRFKESKTIYFHGIGNKHVSC